MKEFVLTPVAQGDLAEIVGYVTPESPSADRDRGGRQRSSG